MAGSLGPRVCNCSGDDKFYNGLWAVIFDVLWRERYHLKPDGSVTPDGSQEYCEYAAVLARVVFGNRRLFVS